MGKKREIGFIREVMGNFGWLDNTSMVKNMACGTIMIIGQEKYLNLNCVKKVDVNDIETLINYSNFLIF